MMNPAFSPSFAPDSPYRRLANSLDGLPNRFPPASDGSNLRLLACLFTPEQADLAAALRLDLETPAQISQRLARDPHETINLLKEMAQKGLIATGKTEQGRLGFGLLPFVVGIYENQNERMDAELARLFEDYFQAAFSTSLAIKPQFHRIVPIGQSIRSTMEVRPFETAADLVNAAQAWAVQDCICRKQKALIGDPCEHPVDICMVLSSRPGAFDGSPTLRALTHEGALATLRRASDAGLVHSVSNNQKDIYYICNCCTCSCAILRGMAKLGKANVVASSAFVNQVDEALCAGCEECAKYCQFNALTVDGVAHVNAVSCVGCGVCVPACPTEALGLVRRPNEEVKPVPETLGDWAAQRAMARGLARE